jgi:hypothetical protein
MLVDMCWDMTSLQPMQDHDVDVALMQMDYEATDEVCVLPCQHFFHTVSECHTKPHEI